MNPPSTLQTTAADTCIAYLGRSLWLVNGQTGTWAASYHHLTRECAMGHAQANQALVQAYHLDQHGQLTPDGEGRT